MFFTFSIFPIAMGNGFFRNGSLLNYLTTGTTATLLGISYYIGQNVVWKEDLKSFTSKLHQLKTDVHETKQEVQQKTDGLTSEMMCLILQYGNVLKW